MSRRLTAGPQYRTIPRLHRFHPYSRTRDGRLNAGPVLPFMQEDVRRWQPFSSLELRDMGHGAWNSLGLQESNHLLYHLGTSSRRTSCIQGQHVLEPVAQSSYMPTSSWLQQPAEDASIQELVSTPSVDMITEFTTSGMVGDRTTIEPMHVTQSSQFGTCTGHDGLLVRSEAINSHTVVYGGQAEGEGWNYIYDTRDSTTLEGFQSAGAYDTSSNWQVNFQDTEAGGQTGIAVRPFETTSEPTYHGQSPSSSHCWLPMPAYDHSSNNLVDGSLHAYHHDPSDDQPHSVGGLSTEASYEPTALRSPPGTEPSLDSFASSPFPIEPLWAPDMPIKSQDRNGVSIPGALWQATLKCYWRGCHAIIPISSCATYANFLKKVFTHLGEHVGERNVPFRCQWEGCQHRPKKTTKAITKRDRIQHVLTHLKRWYHLCTNCGKLYHRKYTGEQKHSCRKNPIIPEHCGEMTLASFWDCYGYPIENIV